MAVDKEQIKQLLGSGLNQEQVASAVGCDPSYVRQLLGDDAFAHDVSILLMKNLTAHNERDRKIDDLEDRLISRLDDTIDYLTKPTDLMRAFAMVNAAKRRGAQAANNAVAAAKSIVQLTLPVTVVQKFVTNKQGEVIEVEGQTMVTMPAHQLLKNLSTQAAKDGGKSDEYERVARYLPGTTGGKHEDEGGG